MKSACLVLKSNVGTTMFDGQKRHGQRAVHQRNDQLGRQHIRGICAAVR